MGCLWIVQKEYNCSLNFALKPLIRSYSLYEKEKFCWINKCLVKYGRARNMVKVTRIQISSVQIRFLVNLNNWTRLSRNFINLNSCKFWLPRNLINLNKILAISSRISGSCSYYIRHLVNSIKFFPDIYTRCLIIHIKISRTCKLS